MKLRDALMTIVLVMIALLLWRHLAADRADIKDRSA